MIYLQKPCWYEFDSNIVMYLDSKYKIFNDINTVKLLTIR